MSFDSNRERIDPSLFEQLRPVCPDCGAPISLEPLACYHCDLEGDLKYGIPSLLPDRDDHQRLRDDHVDGDSEPQLLDADELARLATRVETESIREATATVLEDHEHRSTVLDAMYDVNRDAWTTLVADRIGGRCLDADAGFGRRAHVLAELGESVVAVESNLGKIRIAAARDDYDSADRLVPIHTTDDRLPFEEGSFDTIVADFTDSSMATVRTRLSRLNEYLADDGTAIFVADGWPRRIGLTDLVGLEPSDTTGVRKLTGGTPAAYRSVATDAGFDSISLYTLFPTSRRPLFVFDVESDRVAETLIDFVLAERGRLARVGKPLVSLGNRFGLLNRWYPTVLAVCTNGSESSPSTGAFDDPLLVSGRTRSVVLDIGSGGIDRVRKYPNRRAHSPFTERENAVLSYLRSTNEPIVETLPQGRSVESPFGEARAEDPVGGSPLANDLSEKPHDYERVLQLGFDWLVEFQRAFRGPTVTRSPDEVRHDLRFELTGIEPPPIDRSVTTFFTPVHGDYLAGNIHVADGAVTSVIDWEYSALEASPIVDAGLLVLNTAMQVFGGLEDGFRTAFCEDNEYARITRSVVREYCRALGIPIRTFVLYLPSAYLHRLELDWQFDAVSTYTEKTANRSTVVEFVFDHLSDVELG